MILKKGMLWLCLFGMLIAWTGWCAAGEEKDHICFRKIDTDQNGEVTLTEFAVHFQNQEKLFKAADVNGDGVLSHEEYHELIGHGAK